MKNRIKKRKLNNTTNNTNTTNNKLTVENIESIESQLRLVLKGEEVNQKELQELRLGFIELTKETQGLLDLNNELSKQLEKVVEELEILKQEREEKKIRKQARANRKRLAKRDPITPEIYEQLITSIIGFDYKSVRLRLAILILTISGIRVNELLSLKVNQLLTLVKSNWISINRSKGGPSSHKAYLTALGKKLMDNHRQDFEIIFIMKKLDGYLFTSEKNQYKPLRRDTLTKEINLVLRNLSKNLPEKPNLTTHSFRIGFISQLWRDTNDIEFVKQAIGHTKYKSGVKVILH